MPGFLKPLLLLSHSLIQSSVTQLNQLKQQQLFQSCYTDLLLPGSCCICLWPNPSHHLLCFFFFSKVFLLMNSYSLTLLSFSDHTTSNYRISEVNKTLRSHLIQLLDTWSINFLASILDKGSFNLCLKIARDGEIHYFSKQSFHFESTDYKESLPCVEPKFVSMQFSPFGLSSALWGQEEPQNYRFRTGSGLRGHWVYALILQMRKLRQGEVKCHVQFGHVFLTIILL